MDRGTLSAKLSALSNHRLVTIKHTPLWEMLLRMLRPTDILSLAKATMLCLRPTRRQMNKYMSWWRQTFYNIAFVRNNAIYVVGKDLDVLRTAIMKWNYVEADKVKLLIGVWEPRTMPQNEKQMLRNALFESISTSYVWGSSNQKELHSQGPPVQTCIIFFDYRVDVRMDEAWSESLCLDVLRPPTERLRVDRSGASPRTWIVDLGKPNNVGPCVARRTPSRDNFTLEVSQVSPS